MGTVLINRITSFLRTRNFLPIRFNTLGFDPITVDIIEQVNQFSTAEKEILLKHLKLSNAIKSGETTTV